MEYVCIWRSGGSNNGTSGLIGGTGFFYSLQQPSSFKRKKTGSGIQKDGSSPPSQQSPPLSPCQTKKKKRSQKFSPETVVIPSDKKGLLCALVRAMAELKAGNTSMRNLVVPLALEAKRRGILPKEYSNVDNLNWIYAWIVGCLRYFVFVSLLDNCISKITLVWFTSLTCTFRPPS